MSEIVLKTGKRKTTVSRNAIRQAVKAVINNNNTSTARRPARKKRLAVETATVPGRASRRSLH